MLLSELLTSAGLTESVCCGDAEVQRVVTDSRLVREGDCFVAVRGTATDSHQYVASAVASGCSAVVCETAAAVPPEFPHAVLGETRVAVGPLAQAILGWPARKLKAIGVTGTNGKTTLTHLLRHILRCAGCKPALLGTITYDTLDAAADAATTTPGPIELADLTDRMVRSGATHLVMEVSSHALDQGRTSGMEFDVGVFTNLSGDHLDYHGTMADYLAAKRRLFESLGRDAHAVINRDDEHGEAMASATAARVLWYGLSAAADVYGKIEGIDTSGSRFELCYGGERAHVRTNLIGRHNVSNCLAAAATAVVLGIDVARIASALSDVAGVPGRLERVASDAPFEVLVDYAHTDDALGNVLSALQPIKKDRRLIVVFGCGGDRDRTKRPRMARVAEDMADLVIVTSDNPRTEQPGAIIDEILAGFTSAGRSAALVEPDRRAAIAAAIAAAETGDIVLIAGKGHENYQVIGAERVHFDDVETAEELLREQRS